MPNGDHLITAYVHLNEKETRRFDERYAAIQAQRLEFNAHPSVAKARAALQPFDKSQVIECLRALERYLTAARRKHARRGPAYMAATEEIKKVRELIGLIAL